MKMVGDESWKNKLIGILIKHVQIVFTVVLQFVVYIGTCDLSVSLQVRSDYMQYHASKVSDGMALQLGCLEIR